MLDLPSGSSQCLEALYDCACAAIRAKGAEALMCVSIFINCSKLLTLELEKGFVARFNGCEAFVDFFDFLGD